MEKIDVVIQMLKATNQRLDRLEAENQRRFEAIEQKLNTIDEKFIAIGKHLEHIEHRIERVETRLDRVETRLDRMEDAILSDREKLQAVYDARERVKIDFGWQWSAVSFVMVIMGASIVKIRPF